MNLRINFLGFFFAIIKKNFRLSPFAICLFYIFVKRKMIFKYAFNIDTDI